jgi:hypothetical protein
MHQAVNSSGVVDHQFRIKKSIVLASASPSTGFLLQETLSNQKG